MAIMVAPSPAIAADPALPDNSQLLDVKVYRHILETNDFLLVALYNIEYAVAPTPPANELFLFRLMDGVTILGDSIPYSYGLDGYQYGITSMYFEPAESPTWGSNFIMEITANPTAWENPPAPLQYSLIPTDYTTAATQDDAAEELQDWLIDAAQDIEDDWNVPGEIIQFAPIGTIFTAVGQQYLQGAIPGLPEMVPNLFPIKPQTVDWTEDTWTNNRTTVTKALFAGTIIEDLQDSLSNIFGGVDAIYITSAFIIVVVLGLLTLSFVKFKTADPALGLIPIVLWAGAKIDFFPWELFALVVFIAAAYTGIILIRQSPS